MHSKIKSYVERWNTSLKIGEEYYGLKGDCFSRVSYLIHDILLEVHGLHYCIHQGTTKIIVVLVV